MSSWMDHALYFAVVRTIEMRHTCDWRNSLPRNLHSSADMFTLASVFISVVSSKPRIRPSSTGNYKLNMYGVHYVTRYSTLYCIMWHNHDQQSHMIWPVFNTRGLMFNTTCIPFIFQKKSIQLLQALTDSFVNTEIPKPCRKKAILRLLNLDSRCVWVCRRREPLQLDW